MSTTKKMVGHDYIDAETGLRFVEDVRGNLHLVHTMGDMNMPAPIVNVEAPIVNVPAPVVNVETQSPVTNNYYNTTNNYPPVSDYSNAQRVVIQTKIANFTWASTTDFNRISAGFGATGYVSYTVPFGKEFHFIGLRANQFVTGTGKMGISYIGIYSNGVFQLALPFIDNLQFRFDRPLIYPASTFVELKFLPFDKKADLGVFMLGYTL